MSIRKRIRRFMRALRVSRTVRLSIWIPLLIILVGVLLWGTSAFSVNEVAVEGTRALEVADIQRVAQEALKEPLVGPWLSGNAIVFPKAKIINTLADQFPRIDTVDVSRTLRGNIMRIKIIERQTFAIYCVASEEPGIPIPEGDDQIPDVEQVEQNELGTFPPLQTDACFLMDRSGVVFADAPETEGSLIMTLIDATAGELFSGDQAIDSETLEEIIVTWETFTQGISIKPRRVLKRPGGVITIETFEGWEAVLSNSYPLQTQVIALRELLAKELTAEDRSTIEVIDLRVPGRIYYK